MRTRHLHVLLLAACASQAAEPAAPQRAQQVPGSLRAAALPQRRPARVCSPGRLNLMATNEGIILDPDPMGLMERWTTARARLLRLDGDSADLYFFDATRPLLMTIDRGSPPDNTRVVLELPPIAHPGFTSSDPLASLQRQEDLSITDHILCMDLHDRAEDPTLTYNLRIDLVSAKHERRLVEDLTGDRCGVEREAVAPRLCTPAGPSARDSYNGTCASLTRLALAE